MREKTCPKCNQIKSAENFYARRNSKYGLASYCKSCEKESQKVKYLKFRELYKDKYKRGPSNPFKSKAKILIQEYYLLLNDNKYQEVIDKLQDLKPMEYDAVCNRSGNFYEKFWAKLETLFQREQAQKESNYIWEYSTLTLSI